MEIPAEWLVKICEHTWPDKKLRYHENYLSEEWALIQIQMRTCECYRYDRRALNVCVRCAQVKPTNFAHPAKCCVFYSRARFQCWDCITEQDLKKCPCDECSKRDFARYYGNPLTQENSWYRSLLRTIPPPADFVPTVYDFDTIFEDLGLDL